MTGSGFAWRLRSKISGDTIDVSLQISGSTALTGREGDPYAGGQYAAFGGVAPYTYSVGSGSLPTGVTLNASTGALSTGIASAAGTYTFSVKATDSLAQTATADEAVVVIAALPLPSFIVADQPISFGALTKAGAGGFPVVANRTITNAVINSGNTGTHWQITAAGVITPTAAGDTADLGSGPYALGCTFTASDSTTDTATITITTSGTDANGYSRATMYHAASVTELQAALTAIGANTASNKTVVLRDRSDYGAWTPSSRDYGTTTGSVVTVRSETPTTAVIRTSRGGGAVIGPIVFSGVSHLTIRYLDCYAAYAGAQIPGVIRIGGSVCDHLSILNCAIHSTYVSEADRLISDPTPTVTTDDTAFYNGGHFTRDGITASGTGKHTNLALNDNWFYDLHEACHPKIGNGYTFKRNLLTDNYQSAGISGSGSATVESNVCLRLYANAFDNPENPHFSYFGCVPDQTGDQGPIIIRGNIGANPYSRSNPSGIKLDDKSTKPANPGAYFYTNCVIAGNLIVGGINIMIAFEQASNSLMFNNTVVTDIAEEWTGSQPGLYLYAASTNCKVANNIAAGINTTATLGPSLGTGNTSTNNITLSDLSLQPAGISSRGYNDIFDGPGFSNVTDPLVVYKIKSGGAADTASPKCGAVGSGYCTYPANHLLDPGDVVFDDSFIPT